MIPFLPIPDSGSFISGIMLVVAVVAVVVVAIVMKARGK